MTLLPDGGAAIPVSVTTTRKVQGGSAIPVYGYMTAPTDGRPAMGGAALPVRVLTAADLKQNGGMWTLDGRPHAMPVYTAPAGATVQGGPAIAVYPVNAWPTVPVVPAFVPTDIAGLQLWLKADVGLYKDAAKAQAATADGDAVYTWADMSGNGRDMVQAAAGSRPTRQTLGGLPCVKGDGTDDFISVAFSILDNTSTGTFFLVAQKVSAGADKVFATDENRSSFAILGHGTGELLYYPNSLYNGFNDGHWPDGVTKVATFIKSGANITWRMNGANTHTAAGSVNFGVMAGIYLFAYPYAGYGAHYIKEFGIYSGALTGANLTNLEAYLNSRWTVY